MGRHGALQKKFLRKSDLANGGFPKDIANVRDIHEVANALENAGILITKTGDAETKFGLADKAIVQPILDTKEFPDCMRKFFDRSDRQCSTRYLNYNEA